MGIETLAKQTAEPFVVLFNKSVELLPGVIVALIMIFLGLFLSKWIITLSQKLLNAVKLDVWTEKIGVNDILSRVGCGKSPTNVISFLLSWTVMIIFIMLAADSLHLKAISQMMETFLAFLPKLFVCIVILFAGILFARFVERLVNNSAKVNGIKGGSFIAKFVNIIIVVFTIILALQQININFVLINQVMADH